MQYLVIAALFAAPLQTPTPPADESAPEDAPAAAIGAPDPLRFSILSAPLYLDESRPEVRSLRHVYMPFSGVPGARRDAPTRDEAEAVAHEALAECAAGAEFTTVARRYSRARDAGTGGVLGSFAPGVLAAPFESFLWSAEVDEVSELLEDEHGFHILQRVPSHAAHEVVSGGDDADAQRRVRELRSELRAGADFAELAREHSDDLLTKDRGGLLAIFERGTSDVLLKAAAFDSAIGVVVGPIVTPVGLHLLERIPVADADPALSDPTWVRGSAIVIAYEGARGLARAAPRDRDQARELALDLTARLRAGESFADLAREVNDDVGGRERGGDLGWLHRRSPKMSPVLDRLFTGEAGEVFDPVLTETGWIVLQRVPDQK